MTDVEIKDWLARHENVHGKEISFRVVEARVLLTEIMELREEVARLREAAL